MKTNQMRMSREYLHRICYSEGVSHHHLFGHSKAGRGMGELSNGENGRLQVCPDWRWLAWGSCR